MKLNYLKILKSDVVLGSIITEPLQLAKQDLDLYKHLLRAIVGQQLSTKAAETIWKRFENLFTNNYPTSSDILNLDIEQLRAVGLSYQKANYLKNIANFHQIHDLNSKKIKQMKAENLIAFLTEIKGVGKWTVEMILMFALGNKDVFPIDDLGIKNAMKLLYDLPTTKKEQQLKMIEISDNWRPYRTYACLYLWRYKDNKPIANKI